MKKLLIPIFMQLPLLAIPPLAPALYVPAIVSTHAQVMPHTLTMDEEQPKYPSLKDMKNRCVQCNNHPLTQKCKEAAPLCAVMLAGSCCIMLCTTITPIACIECIKHTGFGLTL
ncbi:MAG: hypothetical protein WD055_05530 [Candidatus Dependentiae bacterium]